MVSGVWHVGNSCGRRFWRNRYPGLVARQVVAAGDAASWSGSTTGRYCMPAALRVDQHRAEWQAASALKAKTKQRFCIAVVICSARYLASCFLDAPQVLRVGAAEGDGGGVEGPCQAPCRAMSLVAAMQARRR